MADLPGVHEAYELAVRAHLLHVSATRVRRDLSSPAVTDPSGMAAALSTAAVEVGVWIGEVSDHVSDVVEAVGEQLPGVLSALYAEGPPPTGGSSGAPTGRSGPGSCTRGSWASTSSRSSATCGSRN